MLISTACGARARQKLSKPGSSHHGLRPPRPWSRVLPFSLTQNLRLLPHLFNTHSLSSSPYLSKTSISNLQSSSISHSIHPIFFLISLNSFLFLQFLHKSFNFLRKFHPRSPSIFHLFHFKFHPFLSLVLPFSSKKSFVFFPFLSVCPYFSKNFPKFL